MYNKDAVFSLAHFIQQKNLNEHLYKEQIIPQYMYEKAHEILYRKINDLEKRVYI